MLLLELFPVKSSDPLFNETKKHRMRSIKINCIKIKTIYQGSSRRLFHVRHAHAHVKDCLTRSQQLCKDGVVCNVSKTTAITKS